ncbi:MAG: CpaD family pilus assembly protein [Rhizobiaceae bacterium]|nr:CpaD family pilus assembly protein [Rhizobiaceae bacterium]
MSNAVFRMKSGDPSRCTRLVLAAAAVALLAGCAQKRDSVVVGAIPDDYRTNHPIVIAEKEETLDLPVGSGDRGATASQRATLEGFLANYDRTAAPTLTIIKPSGSANAAAASNVAADFAKIAKQNGVPGSRIMIASYQASPEEVSAPVRVSFVGMQAQTGKCGRWPDDLLKTSENKHYANFGCSYQNNVAAQVANPSDLLGPRKQTPIDAENRGRVIGEYQRGDSVFSENIGY